MMLRTKHRSSRLRPLCQDWWKEGKKEGERERMGERNKEKQSFLSNKRTLWKPTGKLYLGWILIWTLGTSLFRTIEASLCWETILSGSLLFVLEVLTPFFLDYLFKGLVKQTTLEDRKSVSLWGKGRLLNLFSIFFVVVYCKKGKISLWGKGWMLFADSPIKRIFPQLQFITWDTRPHCGYNIYLGCPLGTREPGK